MPGTDGTDGRVRPAINARLIAWAEESLHEAVIAAIPMPVRDRWRKGDPILGSRPLHRKYTDAGIEFEFVEGDPWRVESYVTLLLDALDRTSTLRELLRTSDIVLRLQIGVHVYKQGDYRASFPSMFFDPRLIERMASWGVYMDLDLWHWEDCERVDHP